MKKKFLSIVLALSMLCAFVPLVASAATSGTCGENVTWTLDEDGTLTISGTGDMDSSDFSRYDIKSVIIENSVTSIGDYTFSGCVNLTSITIPDSVTSIGNHAFDFCLDLPSIKLSSNLTSIGDQAFYQCKKLTSITIPSSVTSIGEFAFYECIGLTSINVDKYNPKYCSVNGNVFSKDKTELIEYASGKTEKSYIVPNGVTSIGVQAFSCCKLTSIKLSNSVTNIGEKAFSECSDLTSIEIPNSVTSIEKGAFYSCSDLTSIEIPNSVTSIENYTFTECTGLTSIEIPNTVTSIGWYAFHSCSSLKSITIPSGVTSIEDCTFVNCTGLKSITIPSKVTSIGEFAFSKCTGLTNIEIPSSVTSIDYGAFSECNSLTDVYYGGTKEQWNKINMDEDNNANDSLKKATIHYTRNLPMTTATITKTKTSKAYTFNVEPEQKYENCYVYAAMYDENGLLTGFERVPLEMSGSTSISIDKTDKAESARVFVLSDMLQPVIQAQEFNIE